MAHEEGARPRRPPAHLLHVGPWADGVTWRAIPNKGLMPTVKYPAKPLLALTDTTQVSFTLNRDGPSEASTEFYTDCEDAIIIEEMITDLWWRRRNFDTQVTENISRFQARDVQVTSDSGLIRCQVQWHDYRGVLESRIVTNRDHASNVDPPGTRYVGGTTPVTTVLKDILPANSLVDLSALNTTNLGTIGLPLWADLGDKVPEMIEKIRAVSPLFDWDVELVGDAAVLALYPGGRGSTTRGVVLVDKGRGWSPMKRWDRRVSSEDYANDVIVTGQTGSQRRTLSQSIIPQGPRDHREDDHTLVDQDWVGAKAEMVLAERSTTKISWQIELEPGYWRGRSHIDLGDTIRVVAHLGEEKLDDPPMRVEQITVNVPATGIEQVTLTLGLARPNPDPRSSNSVYGRILRKMFTRAK